MERVLHLEDDLRPVGGGLCRVAGELDGVAEALVAMQQDGFSGERCVAQP